MTMTDPVADMLTRIRNANTAMHDSVKMPSSKLKESLAVILQREGYIAGYDIAASGTGPGSVLEIQLKYAPDRTRTIAGLKRVSRPGLRIYARADGLQFPQRRLSTDAGGPRADADAGHRGRARPEN